VQPTTFRCSTGSAGVERQRPIAAYHGWFRQPHGRIVELVDKVLKARASYDRLRVDDTTTTVSY
jgi:hypothetical protein